METIMTIMFMTIAVMVVLFIWLRLRGAPSKRLTISEEATTDLETVLAGYRTVVNSHKETLIDIHVLPDSKEIIKEYLHVAIGLAHLNKEPDDQLLEEYYLLAHFQDVEGQNGPEGMDHGYDERIADETLVLEKELKAFLKRRRLF